MKALNTNRVITQRLEKHKGNRGDVRKEKERSSGSYYP